MNKVPIVMCFGDSLTAGFQSPSRSNPTGKDTPYGYYLQELIGPDRQVVVSGICGELTGEMVMRFRQDVLSRKPSHVIILGGTNDLGWNAQPGEIMRNLVKMYEQARADQVVPVPVTVPSIRAPGDSGGQEAQLWIGDHLSRRRQLNGLIAEYADSHDLAWIDLFQATLEKETEQLADAYSNDGLHLTTAGYRMLAQLVYQRVFAAPFSAQARPQ